MKILIYAHLFPPSIGGLQYSNLQKAQGLSSLGHDVEVIACNNKGTRSFAERLNFPVHLLPKWPFAPMHSTSGISLLNWIFIPYYVRKIAGILRNNPPDVVLVADETANFFWGFLATQYKGPYVSYCSVPLLSLLRTQGDLKLLWRPRKIFCTILRRRLKISYANSELMLVVSNSTKKQLAIDIPDIALKAHIVPNSIDDMFFNKGYQDEAVSALKDRFAISEQNFTLLSATRLTSDKGVDDILKALHGLSPSYLSRLRYVIVGDGPAFLSLKDLAASLSLDKVTIFTGEVPNFELIAYYDMCDLFALLPRRGPYESFGRVFVEAAARSKPSIASMEGGMPEVIDNRSTGILVPPGDIAALRDTLMYLIDNRDILTRLGENAKVKADNNYTTAVVSHQFEAYLKIALESQIQIP